MKVIRKKDNLYISFTYDTIILSKVRTLYNRKWNSKTKNWVAPATESNINKLKDWGFIFDGEIIPVKQLDDDLLTKEEIFKAFKDINIPKIKGLRDYQHEALQFFTYKKGKALLADDMGTGKTISSLAFLKLNSENLPALIVVPASIKTQWLTEYVNWVDNKVIIVRGRTPFNIPKNTSVIINWDILSYWESSLSKKGFKTLIADEAHFANNIQARRTKACIKLSRIIPNVLLLTGTPISSRPSQLFPLLHMLDQKRFKSITKYKDRYCKIYKDMWGYHEDKTIKNEKELYFIMNNYMLKRDKSTVLKHLKKQRIPIFFNKASKESEELMSSLLNILDINNKLSSDQIDALQRSSFADKKVEIVKWLNEYLSTGEKIVVFTKYKATINYLETALGKRCIKIDGSVNIGEQRDKVKQQFMENKNIQILLVQIDAGGIGIDGLQKICSTCAFVEFGYTAKDHEQAEDRLNRSGQEKLVNCYYFITKKTKGEKMTIDERLFHNLDKTSNVTTKAIQGRSANEKELFTIMLKK